MSPAPRAAHWLSGLWAAVWGAASVAALWYLATARGWHLVRQMEPLLRWQTAAALVCTVLLLVLSKGRYDAVAPAWSRPATLWVLGGILAALVLQLGALPRWVVQPHAWQAQALLIALWLLQGVCAGRTCWLLRRSAACVSH